MSLEPYCMGDVGKKAFINMAGQRTEPGTRDSHVSSDTSPKRKLSGVMV
jgi:hypothetical protein